MNNKKLIKNSNWQLIVIDDDPKLLPGKSIFDLLQLLLKRVEFKYVILNDIEGIAEGAVFLKDKEGEVLEVDYLLKNICNIVQFEWGDFFLFTEYPSNWKSENFDYPDLIKQTDTTVRAVDNQYMYIYTPYEDVLDIVKEGYTIESVKSDTLENLDYPY
ncbi:MAG TPA: hypothetical protein VGP47_05380 [Parachlamydiaceae bacterium]|nr:hypothetical protein [Parachlamydiaceae bacterium]